MLSTYLSSTFNPSASLSRPMCIVSDHEIIASFILVNKQASSVNCLKATTPNLRGKSLLVAAQVDRFTVEPADKTGGYPSRYLHMRAKVVRPHMDKWKNNKYKLLPFRKLVFERGKPVIRLPRDSSFGISAKKSHPSIKDASGRRVNFLGKSDAMTQEPIFSQNTTGRS